MSSNLQIAELIPNPIRDQLSSDQVLRESQIDTLPPAYPDATYQSQPEIDMPLHIPYSRFENLPVYAAEPETEPQTLARGLWLWGWGFPVLWIIGMCMWVSI